MAASGSVLTGRLLDMQELAEGDGNLKIKNTTQETVAARSCSALSIHASNTEFF